LQTKARETPDN